MSEAQDDYLDTPCEACHAAVGEQCRPDCIGAAAFLIDQGVDWENADEDTDLGRESKRALTGVLSRLPYSGASFLKPVPVYGDCSTDEWLARIVLWMDDYRQFLTTQVDQLQADSRKAMSLQFERDVVRKFLTGTPVSAS